MTHDDYREMISFYIDDSLSETEKEAFEAHVKECPECKEELEVMRQLLQGLNEMEELELPAGFGKELEAKLLAVNAEMAEAVPVSLEEKRNEKKKLENEKKRTHFQWRYAYNTAAALILVVAVTAFFNSGIHFMDKASKYAAPQSAANTEKQKNTVTPTTTPASVSPAAVSAMAIPKEATGGTKVGDVTPTTATYDLSASNSGKFDPTTNVVSGETSGAGNGENRSRNLPPSVNTVTPTPTAPPQNEMFAMMKAAPRELVTGNIFVKGNKEAYLSFVKNEISASGGVLLGSEEIDGKLRYTFEISMENFWSVYEKVSDQNALKELPELKEIELKRSEDYLDKTAEYEDLSKAALESTEAGLAAAKALKELENALLKAKIVIILQD